MNTTRFTAAATTVGCVGDGSHPIFGFVQASDGRTVTFQPVTLLTYCGRIAKSNAMDGLSAASPPVSVRTGYDDILTGVKVASGLLILTGIAICRRQAAHKKS